MARNQKEIDIICFIEFILPLFVIGIRQEGNSGENERCHSFLALSQNSSFGWISAKISKILSDMLSPLLVQLLKHAWSA